MASKDFPNDYKGEQLHFGQGGGFTGIVTHYAMLDDSRVFQKDNRDTSFTFFEKWNKNFVEQMFDSYYLLGLDKLEHYHPGNLYYFIEHHSASGEIHRISWGQTGYMPKDHVVNFYNLLYRSTKTKS